MRKGWTANIYFTIVILNEIMSIKYNVLFLLTWRGKLYQHTNDRNDMFR